MEDGDEKEAAVAAVSTPSPPEHSAQGSASTLLSFMFQFEKRSKFYVHPSFWLYMKRYKSIHQSLFSLVQLTVSGGTSLTIHLFLDLVHICSTLRQNLQLQQQKFKKELVEKMFSNSWTESFICDFYQTVWCHTEKLRGAAVGLSAHLVATRRGLPSASSWPHPHSLRSRHRHIFSHRAHICLSYTFLHDGVLSWKHLSP